MKIKNRIIIDPGILHTKKDKPSSSIQTVTVGTGVSPVRSLARLADCTASGDLHPALKISCSFVRVKYTPNRQIVQEKFILRRYRKIPGKCQAASKQNCGSTQNCRKRAKLPEWSVL